MDFEGLLTNEALRPLMSEFVLHLMDHSDTASLISRLPPPKIAMLYHAALLGSAGAARTQGELMHEAERLCASVLDAYALSDGGVDGRTAEIHGACVRPARPVTTEEAPPAMSIYPALCQRLAEAEDKQPFLEEALAAREARLQHRIVTLAADVSAAPSTLPAFTAPL